MSYNILHITSSGRQDSVSAAISRQIVDKLVKQNPGATVVERNLLRSDVPFVDGTLVTAYFSPPDTHTPEMAAKVRISNEYTAELIAADAVVIGLPIYNFSVPGVLKSYFDLVSRVGLTFNYGESGPVGLLENKQAYLAVVSGGTPVGSDWDYASNYATHFLNFLGISDVQMVVADGLTQDAEVKLEAAAAQVAAL